MEDQYILRYEDIKVNEGPYPEPQNKIRELEDLQDKEEEMEGFQCRDGDRVKRQKEHFTQDVYQSVV